MNWDSTDVNTNNTVNIKRRGIFAWPVPRNIFENFLNNICDKEDGYYIFDDIAFRRMKYTECYEPFAQTIVQYCKYSMRHFIIRSPTFASVALILRHICPDHSTTLENARRGRYRAFRVCLP